MTGATTYELFDQIGSGGMATVHRARQHGAGGVDRMVAVKQLQPHLASNAELVERFARELQIASVLDHPNIIQIYDGGVAGPDGHFIAMELVEGCSLIELLRAMIDAKIAIPTCVVLSLLHQLCDALDHAHTRVGLEGPLGIVHRDINPANLLVSWAGQLKVIDFGISTTARSPVSCTVAGKPSYMAPETLGAADVDARADLFAVGIVAWELLARRPLFTRGSEPETIDRVLDGVVPPPSIFAADCPRELDAWVLAALAKDRDLRPPSAAAMRGALERMIAHGGYQATREVVARWLAAPELRLALANRPAHRAPVTRTYDRLVIVRSRDSIAEVDSRPIAGAAVVRPASVRPTAPSTGWSRVALTATLAIVAAAVLLVARPSSSRGLVGRPVVVHATQVRAAGPTATPLPSREAGASSTATPLSSPEAGASSTVTPSSLESPRPAIHRIASERARRTGKSSRSSPPLRAIGVTIEARRAPIETPPAVDYRWPPAPASLPPLPPTRSPVTIAPGRVHRRSGQLAALDLHRLEREGLLGTTLHVRLCIDEGGAVTSQRFYGDVPAWLRTAVGADLERFRFTPYADGSGPRAACFMRSLPIVSR